MKTKTELTQFAVIFYLMGILMLVASEFRLGGFLCGLLFCSLGIAIYYKISRNQVI
jgi:hypothetical protein